MNRLRGYVATTARRWIAHARGPVARTFDGHVDAAVTHALLVHVAPALGRLEVAAATARERDADADRLLDGLVRELGRLRRQVEALEAAARERP